ncbi:hypothetical protein FS837_012527 [Tulasnella sp. UAMH 9824]|nr:hypothetical protein FS837_012527 [Tulasnella sp. UAMH 9824]
MNTLLAELKDDPRDPGPRPVTFRISDLPSELLTLVLHYALPLFDPLEWFWEYEDCNPYMAALFSLRCVSTSWRDLIDGTPPFWALISSTWSSKVITMALHRSGACPLIIHHLPPDLPEDAVEVEIAFGREFYQLVNPHRSRWIAGIIALPLELASEFFDSPLPRLQVFKLTLTDEEALGQPTIPITPIIIDVLANLEHVHLNCLPFPWKEVLAAFKRLKTLGLSLLRGHGISAEQIIDAIQKNPGLESIMIGSVEAEAEPMPVDWAFSNPTPVSLPLLRLFKTDGSLYLLDAILRHIQIPNDLEEIIITAIPSGSFAHNRHFWMKTVSALLPSIQIMHMAMGGSSIAFEEGNLCIWAADGGEDKGFKLSIDGLGHTATLEWIASVVKSWEHPEDLPGFSCRTTSASIGVRSTFDALQAIPRVTSIDISVGPINAHLWEFLEGLGGPTNRPTTSPPSFPFLQSLVIRKWRFGLAKFIEVMKRRYATQQPKGWRPHSNIRLDFATHRPVWFEDRKRPQAIIHMYKVQELRELDGVDSVRISCLKEQSGLLAVVWDNEEDRAVWG